MRRRVELAGSAEILAYHWRYQLPATDKLADAGDLPGPEDWVATLSGESDVPRRSAHGP